MFEGFSFSSLFVSFRLCSLRFSLAVVLRTTTVDGVVLNFYSRKDSPWLWVQWGGGGVGKRTCQRTALRKDDPDFERKRALLRLDWQRRLLLAGPSDVAQTAEDAEGGPGATRDGHGWAWVVSYLATRYRAKERSRKIYQIQWRWLFEFFAGREIMSPAELQRVHCFDYISWRTSQVKQKSRKSPKLNTALGELKLLRLVMREAVTRGLAVENPAVKMDVERDEPEPKPDITDAEAAKIYAALEGEPQCMQRAFFLAFNTGLRFATTRLHRSQVFWDQGRIMIEKPKGGRKREFAIEIYPAIEPLLRGWWESGEPWFWTPPKGEETIMGLRWTRFFRGIGLPHLCFHCTRVAFITRGAMAGVPESAMLQMVNHARSEIHRIYQRWRPGRFREFAAQISSGVKPPKFAAAATRQSPNKRNASRASGNRAR